MVSTESVAEALCDPERFTLEQASALALKLKKRDPEVDRALLRRLLAWTPAPTAKPTSALRNLELIAALRGGLNGLFLARLLQHPDAYVRSRAATLLSKMHPDPKWVSFRLKHPDPRVRANALESLWGSLERGSRAIFLEGLRDPHQRVRGNALLGLYRLGDVGTIASILQMAQAPEESSRGTAAWVMAQTRDLRFLEAVRRLVEDPSPLVRGRAQISLQALEDRRRVCAGYRKVPLAVAAYALDQVRLLRVALIWGAGPNLPSVPATAFALWEDEALVDNYSIGGEPGLEVEHITWQVEYQVPAQPPERPADPPVRLHVCGEDWIAQAEFHLTRADPGGRASVLAAPSDPRLEALEQEFAAPLDPHAVAEQANYASPRFDLL
ncbi:MAG TPA: HEAT repeat domain-containing protein [Bryobacteraceae bacterium]|nr:HEAT repeat domain-containing protein [Bryobacteraceae bacterium]